MIRSLHHKIQEEQQAKSVALLESLAVSLFSVITAALLPQLIVQYLVRDGEFPTSQPLILTYLPHFCYALVFFSFVFAVLSNIARSRRIQQYKREIELLALTGDDCCCDGNCSHGAEGEEFVSFDDDSLEEVVMEPVVTKAPRAAKKSAAKKTSKRSSKK